MKPEIKNFKLYRGNRDKVNFVVKGDYTNYSAILAFKTNTDLSTTTSNERSLEMSNSDNITITKSGDNTIFSCDFLPELTKSLAAIDYYYGLQITNIQDQDEIYTPYRGIATLDFDVATPFDGYILPSGTTSFFQLDASDYEDGTIAYIQEVDGIKTATGITIDELKVLLGIT